MRKRVQSAMENSSSSGSKIFYWIIGACLIPVAFPLAAINIWQRYRERKCRNLLPGKVVLITGASSGLGESLAHIFYRAGCKIILAARRLEELERVKKDLLSLDVQSIAYPPTVLQLDLTDLNEIPAFVSKVLSIHNHIDILINNGGISVRAKAVTASVDVDLKVMVVNYFGAVALTKAVLPSMIKRCTGNICFISSVQGKFALPMRSAYSASKHAIQAFADSLRAEVAGDNITVTCFSPGYIRTHLSINALTGNGQTYGKMDETTAAGCSPMKMAHRILEAILRNEKDVVVCDWQGKLAFYLRFLYPQLFFWLMKKRALRLQNGEALESKTK